MLKRKHDQAQKTVHERIDATHVKMRLGRGAKKDARKRPRTPSTEMTSNDDVPNKPRTVSPRRTSMLEQNYRSCKRNFNKKTNKVKTRRGEENDSEEPTNSELEKIEEQDSKVSKNKKNNRK